MSSPINIQNKCVCVINQFAKENVIKLGVKGGGG